jgi:hypothetical protein
MIIRYRLSSTASSPVYVGTDQFTPVGLINLWKLKAIMGSVTGTATADSTLTVSLSRDAVLLPLFSISSSSTVLTVTGNLDFLSQSSTAGTGEEGFLTGNGILVDEHLQISFVNNGSVVCELIFEEVIV